MGSDAHRWQAAMGAIAGSLVADTSLSGGSVWSEQAQRSLDHAEALLAGHPAPIELPMVEAVPLAVGLSAGPPPLLAEAGTVELVDLIGAGLASTSVPRARGETIAAALELGRGACFRSAVRAAGPDRDLAVIAGALVGLRGGIGAVPARLVSTITAADGRRGRRYLSRLVDRLLDLDRTDWYDPRHRRGPAEVLPGVWLANIYGVGAFVTENPDGLVVSLCDVEGRLDDHGDQVTFHIDDTPKPDANPSLAVVLDEVMAEIQTARTAGQPVLVHCRHGASRTGLVLRLLLMVDLGLGPDDALTEAQCRWPHTSSWNTAWARELERRAGGDSSSGRSS